MSVVIKVALASHGINKYNASLTFVLLLQSRYHFMSIKPRIMLRTSFLEISFLLLAFLLSESMAWFLSPSQNLHRCQSVLRESSCDEFTFEAFYEGTSCKVPIRQDESILSAMERAGVSNRLPIPDVPSDCRRGNCMTCSGRHLEGSETSSLLKGEDGLSPHMSTELANKGHILLCSSHVVGDGLKIQIGEYNRAWNDMFRRRLEDEEAQHTGRVAMAKTIRRSSENNVERWAEETEAVLEKSGE